MLERLYKAGFRCRLDKSQFLMNEVIYLGHRISKEGVAPSSNKVKTLLDAPYPKDVEQLISFLGAVNYYGKYIKNLSSVIDPLNKLRSSETVWKFGTNEKAAFNKLKELIASETVLMQYNPELPLKIDTDASMGGIGAVISHKTVDGERPIEFASRTLTKAERKYSCIEKEALAIVWGLKKFHRYIYAREFDLVTDHKPLTFIFGEKKDIPEMGVSRIQRWAILLASYRYKIEYRPTKLHSNADMCSRFPLKVEADDGDTALQEDVFACEETSEVFQTTFEEKELINHTLVSQYSRTDVIISKVIKQVQEGWSEKGDLPGEYHNRRDELSVEHNCLLWGARVIIPSKLRVGVLELLHATHLGIVNMKALARAYFWWPGITKDIETLAKNCEVCKLNQKNPPKTVLHPWIASKVPWERIHIDFCTYNNDQWLVVVDSYSKWSEVIHMRKCIDSPATIRELRKLFATWGLPKIVVSDNGPSLVSDEIMSFYKNNGIKFIPIPSYKPQCNGLAERMVGTFKSSMKKMKERCSNLSKNLACWLLTYRNTPHGTSKWTPAELMVGRRTRSRLSLLYPEESGNPLLSNNQVMREFKVGEQVYYKDVRQDKWKPGQVCEKRGEKVYLIQGRDGGTRMKHIDQLISGLENPHVEPRVSSEDREIVQNPIGNVVQNAPVPLQPNVSTSIREHTGTGMATVNNRELADPILPSEPPSMLGLPPRSSNRSRKAPERLITTI